MNIKEYISSGVVESYVLGLASEQERIEFEQLCTQYPELVEARNEFEAALEKQAIEMAIAPPAMLKEKITGSVINSELAGKNEARLVSMDVNQKSNKWMRYVAAASVVLLLASAYFAYDLYSKNRILQESYSLLRSQADSIEAINQLLVKEKKGTLDPNSAVVVNMVGTQRTSSAANIYWDTASSKVFLVVKNLPKLPTEKQYQLWAFIEGKPVDLGLFDADNKNVILQMNNTRKAEAFAITIENRGNGSTPQGPVETIGNTDL